MAGREPGGPGAATGGSAFRAEGRACAEAAWVRGLDNTLQALERQRVLSNAVGAWPSPQYRGRSGGAHRRAAAIEGRDTQLS